MLQNSILYPKSRFIYNQQAFQTIKTNTDTVFKVQVDKTNAHNAGSVQHQTLVMPCFVTSVFEGVK